MAAAANGWIDGDAVAREHLLAIRRAGADFVLTYFARDRRRIAADVSTGVTDDALLAARRARIPGGRELAGAGVRRGRRRAVLRGARPRARTSSTPRATATSTTCSRGARRSSATPIPRIVEAVQRRGARRHVVRRADRARGRAGRGDRRPRAERREGAARVERHRGGDDRGPPRPRRHRPRPRS